MRGAAAAFPSIDRREIIMNIFQACYFGPTPADAAILDRRSGPRARHRESGHGRVRFTARAGLLAMRGLADESRAASLRADELWEEVGAAPALRLAIRQPVGEAERFLGRPEVADAIFREMAEQYAASGETGFNSTISALLALSLCDQAKFDEAEVYAARSRRLAAEDDFASQAGWRMTQAQVLLDRGDVGAALALADEAVAINGATDYPNWGGEGYEIRGTILLAAGRVPEARGAISEALARYERKGTVPWAERARLRLEALGV